MYKAEPGGMERLTPKRIYDVANRFVPPRLRQEPLAAIKTIPDQRIADMIHMDPDLVGPPRRETAFDAAETGTVTFQNDIVGYGRTTSVAPDGHLPAMRWVPPDRGVYGSLQGPRLSPYQCNVCALDAVVHELSSQSLMGCIGFCDNQEPRCILVDPMYNAGRSTPPMPERLAPQ